MRVIVVVAVLLLILNVDVVDSRGINLRKYLRNLRKGINLKCNKAALDYTNDKQMYNCFKVNNSNHCKHLDNYTDYYNAKMDCVSKQKTELGNGLIISIIMWSLLLLWFR
jgi:hypothetical protein